MFPACDVELRQQAHEASHTEGRRVEAGLCRSSKLLVLAGHEGWGHAVWQVVIALRVRRAVLGGRKKHTRCHVCWHARRTACQPAASLNSHLAGGGPVVGLLLLLDAHNASNYPPTQNTNSTQSSRPTSPQSFPCTHCGRLQQDRCLRPGAAQASHECWNDDQAAARVQGKG